MPQLPRQYSRAVGNVQIDDRGLGCVSGSISFFAAGGPTLGMGNLVRTAALAAIFLRRNFLVQVLWEASPSAVWALEPRGADVRYLTSREEVWTTLSNDDERVPQILIWDNRDQGVEDVVCAREIGVGLVASLNDSGAGRVACDILLDEKPFQQIRNVPTGFHGQLLAGPRFRIIRDSVRAIRPSNSWANKTVRRVLISLGGADPGGLTSRLIIGIIHSAALRAIDFTVVIGPLFSESHREAISRAAASAKNVTVQHSPSDLPRVMLRHDLVVGMGGISAYEAMCLGRPLALLRWSYMEEYVDGLVAAGLACDLGDVDAAAGRLAALCGEIEEITLVAQRGWSLIDGCGGERVADAVIARWSAQGGAE